MNFFRSILSEDSDLPVPETPQMSAFESPINPPEEHDDNKDYSDRSSPDSAADGGGGWNFGGLIKTFAARSESVIETYRRDLKEFQSGLRKETEVFREVASHAVKDLPASIDGVWKSTAEIISHGKETLLAPSDGESDSSSLSYSNRSLSSNKYSRFDAQLRSIQNDPNTYCEEPEDIDDYDKWKLGFLLDEKIEEVKSLVEENGSIEGIYKRVVPNVVDHETFWGRYFYKVHKLKEQENVRANLVRRAISTDMDEELTWDVEDDDDEDDDEGNNGPKGSGVMVENTELGSEDLGQTEVGSSKIVESNVGNGSKGIVSEISIETEEQTSEVNIAESIPVCDEKVDSDGKFDNGDSCKDSDVSIVSTQPPLPEEEDLGWDEIEDIGSNEERKERNNGSPNRDDLRKRLSAADEDEDLNWDIDDDDDEEEDGAVSKPDSKQ